MILRREAREQLRAARYIDDFAPHSLAYVKQQGQAVDSFIWWWRGQGFDSPLEKLLCALVLLSALFRSYGAHLYLNHGVLYY